MQGKGLYKWNDIRRYYGEWKENTMNGLGIQNLNDHNIYMGGYYQDRKQGYGIYHWNDGRKFYGWWHDNKQLGLGKYSVDGNF